MDGCTCNASHPHGARWRRRRRARGPAFSVVELVVVIAIVFVLLALLIPSLVTTREKMRSLKCASNMKSAAFEFQLFADGTSEQGHGESESLGGERFYIEDFQESIYHVDEFWDYGGGPVATLDGNNNVMMCPSAPGAVEAVPGGPCEQTVLPRENVTIAVNMRLHRPVIEWQGRKVLGPSAIAILTPRVLSHPYAPLMIEVDGPASVAKSADPFYVAPPLEDKDDPYSSGRYWSPGRRHGGATVVAFIGGHVLSSNDPAQEDWDWSYQAPSG